MVVTAMEQSKPKAAECVDKAFIRKRLGHKTHVVKTMCSSQQRSLFPILQVTRKCVFHYCQDFV